VFIRHNYYTIIMNLKQNKKITNLKPKQHSAQNTFIKKWKDLVKEGKIDIMKAALYRVLNDLIIEKHKKHKSIPLDMLMKKGLDSVVEDIPHMIDKLDKESLVLLIKELPLKYQKIMLMRYVEDLELKNQK